MTFICFFFFFNDTATTEIYTLSLHDALPIFAHSGTFRAWPISSGMWCWCRSPSPTSPPPSSGLVGEGERHQDRKSTRLNSSHQIISYAVFCLKKKKNTPQSRDVLSCTQSSAA